jgi:ABC-type transport system involved in cytochrome c biogenesis permease subunit
MGIMFIAVLLGLWLSSLYLVNEAPPKSRSAGLAHGGLGILCILLLFFALHGPGSVKGANAGHPAGSFGWTAFYTLVVALAGGLTIFSLQTARKPVTPLLVAMHATAAIAGAVILCAYWVSPSSYGR